ncbi:MAG: MBL fold metallo-hydrolase [Chloroflexi bacterium]|nr:MBL fold metallo-hydrolase [Chloroflexota bacterium]
MTLPVYFKPTPSVKIRNNYFPGSETLGPDEMRISYVGSCPFPPRRNQAGTAIMVELGNGDRFFFDFGPGCLRNIISLGVPVQEVNDIFLSHLHVDHYHDISYLRPFRAWAGGYTPLRVHGPSGRTEKLGLQGMIDGMDQMLQWHLEAFDVFPIGDGYEVEVNEFDWKDENGICYDKNGVTVRHWRRSHAKDGASAYRLDWNGLSFVWTGDGRPDELSMKYGAGVDVFVTECQTDYARLNRLKYGFPEWLTNYTIDTHHTPHYAVGYMMNEVNPRIGMVTHMEYDEPTVNESIAGIRAHWDGLFAFGAPDGVIVNVTKEEIWVRNAAMPDDTGMSAPDLATLLGADESGKIVMPSPRIAREEQQEQLTRDLEIDPEKYYPEDVYRELLIKLPEPLEMQLPVKKKED